MWKTYLYIFSDPEQNRIYFKSGPVITDEEGPKVDERNAAPTESIVYFRSAPLVNDGETEPKAGQSVSGPTGNRIYFKPMSLTDNTPVNVADRNSMPISSK